MKMSAIGRLYQARMWREYAQAWDRGCRWVAEILRISRAECLRRARINVYLARRLNRQRRDGPDGK